MADRGLPEDFDPENFKREVLTLSDGLEEGVTVLEVLTAKKSSDPGSGIVCWRCRQRPDGTWDCFDVPCPDSWPPPTHEKTLKE